MLVHGLGALTCALALTLLSGASAIADPPPPPAYAEAVQRSYDILQGASGNDSGPAASALRVLVDGTGASQPEIVDDLVARPPLYDDARSRLSALLDALQQTITTSDPALARQRLEDVLAMKRYDPLHRPPTPVERFLQWVQDRIAAFLRLLSGRSGGGPVTAWWIYAAGLAGIAAVVFVLVRAGGGRFSQSVSLSPEGPRPPADFFVEADRLAARGDRVGAIRALCAGVAGTLAGERTWEGSPLTVREIFQRATDSQALRPLLHPFEAAVYGGRDVDPATYERAAQVAAPFRNAATDSREAAA